MQRPRPLNHSTYIALPPWPQDYLTGLGLHLESLRRHKPAQLSAGAHIKGNVIIDSSATIGEGCVIGPNVAIGIGCVIGDGVRISNSVLLHRVKVKNYARVNDAIVGWGSSGACCCRCWAWLGVLLYIPAAAVACSERIPSQEQGHAGSLPATSSHRPPCSGELGAAGQQGGCG